MKIKTVTAIFKTNKPVKEDAVKLRGFVGNKFDDEILLHHHITGQQFLFTYPRVQYKIIKGTPLIVGINEGAAVVKNIADDISSFSLGMNTYHVDQLQLISKESRFGYSRAPQHYRLVTPWLSLNKKNYTLYNNSQDWKEKKQILNNILTGNILSLCKGLNYTVYGRLYVHTHLNHQLVTFKGVKHSGFLGRFKVNFHLPEWLGIGKSTSHGFGTVKYCKK